MLFSPQLLTSPQKRTAVAAPMSLVLTAANSQYLGRTWGSAPTNANKATISFFLKRTATGTFFEYFYDGGVWNGTSGIDEADVRLLFDKLSQVTFDGTILSQFTSSDTVDTSWHHIHYKFDSTDATANNRVRIYTDGVEVPYSTQTPPTQNTSFHLTDNGITSAIGREEAIADRYLDAKLAYFYFIDGQALDPSSFVTGTGAGTTHPATYAGTFGTNGFFLNFTGSATTDQSGSNTNNWTQHGSPTFSSDVPT